MNANTPPRSTDGPSRRVLALAALLTLGGLLGGYFVSGVMQGPELVQPEIPGLLWPDPRRLTAFELDSTDGKALDLERLKGHWSFLFFGYTYCPDICPTTLTTMAAAISELRDAGAADTVQVIFVSVDPARDTLERLTSYVAFFDSAFLGATGPIEQVDILAGQLRVMHVRGAVDDTGNYPVDHSTSVLLIDPRARLVGAFAASEPPGAIASRFQSVRAFVETQP